MMIEVIEHKMFSVVNDNTGNRETTFLVIDYNSDDRGQNVSSHK